MISRIKTALKKYWGYDAFYPLQQKAIDVAVQGRDSLVILPTGGGKSICFQAPAVAMDGVAIVVSPLISLMKDQVDALNDCGISAARLDSSLTPDQRRAVFYDLHQGNLKLLYVAPERLMLDGFIQMMKEFKLSLIAIDEAHCVSMWGHDFRPEYRQLGSLKDIFPGVPIHAFTATATEQVRDDIVQQLRLDDAEVLIGSFDRPNLIYKFQQRANKVKQVCQVLGRHKNESGVIYCISRKNVEKLCQKLNKQGYKALPYHAGLDPACRKMNQDAFIKEKVDIIVATVAFGMGIDKSNVRFVIHTEMPKSLEHYQQESGRAGRDGLEAECCMFYSAADFALWKIIMSDMEPKAAKIAIGKLSDMYDFCTQMTCRHKSILNYFGQDLETDDCAACDVCLGEMDLLEDSLVVSQKILSCVYRINQNYGGDYTAGVLVGSKEKRILQFNHDKISTYGILSDYKKATVRGWVEQLAGQGFLEKHGEFNVLRITARGGQVLKGEITPNLLKPVGKKDKKPAKQSRAVKDSWAGVDRGLYEALRMVRKKIADSKSVPAFVVFGDASIRDMARKRPTGPSGFLDVNGVGEAKSKKYGIAFLNAIKEYYAEHPLKAEEA